MNPLAWLLGLFLAVSPGSEPLLSPDLVSAPGSPTWHLAPLEGADVRSLAFHPEIAELAVAGTSAGQIYLSRDGGRTWNQVRQGPALPGWVVAALLFDPNDPSVLWAGLWGIWGKGLVAVSHDLGGTWKPAEKGLPGEPVYSLAAVPGHPGHLYAGTRSGVYGTVDGGTSWLPLTAGLPELRKVTSLLVDTDQPQTVLAGTWRRAYRSDDGGLSWRGIFRGMVLDSEVFQLKAVPAARGELWASTCGWVYRSLDGGESWARFENGLEERRTPSFLALPGGRLLAGTVAGLYSSDDHGRSWQRRTSRGLTVLSLAIHPDRPERVLLGTEGSGVWVSTDGGDSFEGPAPGMSNLRISALSTSGEELVAAVSHAGPLSGLRRSRDGGESFHPEPTSLPTVMALARAGDQLLAATEKGLYEQGPGGWQRRDELGEARVEELATGAGRLVARTANGLYELTDDASGAGQLRRLPFAHGAPRSLALTREALWVSDEDGLYRLGRASNDSVEVPFPGGRVAATEGGLLYGGDGGLWFLPFDEGSGEASLAEPPSWQRLSEEPALRLLGTGDRRAPFVVVTPRHAFRFLAAGPAVEALDTFFPPRDILAAAHLGDRLLLGTSGYGLVWKELVPDPQPPALQAAPALASSPGGESAGNLGAEPPR